VGPQMHFIFHSEFSKNMSKNPQVRIKPKLRVVVGPTGGLKLSKRPLRKSGEEHLNEVMRSIQVVGAGRPVVADR